MNKYINAWNVVYDDANKLIKVLVGVLDDDGGTAKVGCLNCDETGDPSNHMYAVAVEEQEKLTSTRVEFMFCCEECAAKYRSAQGGDILTWVHIGIHTVVSSDEFKNNINGVNTPDNGQSGTMSVALNTKQIGSYHFGLCKDGSQNNLTIFSNAAGKRRCCACGNTLPYFKSKQWNEVFGLKYDYEGAHLLWACCDDECISRLNNYIFYVMDSKEKDDYIDLMIELYRTAEKEYIKPILNKTSIKLPKGFDA